MYAGLQHYKRSIEEVCDYAELQKNRVIYNIPIIYRNSLEVLRQYIKFNVYNLKECRTVLRALHACRINEAYFWNSVNDWFCIFIKEQLNKKEIE